MRTGTTYSDDDVLGAEPSEGSGPTVEPLRKLPPLTKKGFYYVMMVEGHISKVRHCGSERTYNRLTRAMAEGARIFKAHGRERWSTRTRRGRPQSRRHGT